MSDVAPFLRVDARDPMPVYAQLERRIRAAITAGHLAPGAQLPTVRQLAVDLRVNANTVARVYAQLERDGVVETRRGVGTFIADLSPRTAAEGHDVRKAELERLVERLLSDAALLGFTAEQIVATIEHTNESEQGGQSWRCSRRTTRIATPPVPTSSRS